MKRFYFNLCAARDVYDPCGMLFDSDLQAFRAAQHLASDVGRVRPALRRRAWICLTKEQSADTYCVSIQRTKRRSVS